MSLLFLLIFSEITLSHIRSIAIFAPRIIHVNEPSVLNTDAGACSYKVKGSELDPIGSDNCTGTTLT